jgi:hypothetical protein
MTLSSGLRFIGRLPMMKVISRGSVCNELRRGNDDSGQNEIDMARTEAFDGDIGSTATIDQSLNSMSFKAMIQRRRVARVSKICVERDVL